VPPTPRPPSRPATVLDGIPTRSAPRPRAVPEPRGAGLGAGLLILTGVIVLLLALPLNHVRRTAEPDRLATHATTVLAHPDVQSALTTEATVRIAGRATTDSGLGRKAIRAAVRPRVERLVASERFAAIWRDGVRTAATRLLDPDVPYVAITIDDVGGLTAAVTRPFPPTIARALKQAGPIAIVDVDRTPEQQRALETVEWLNGLALPLLFVGAAALLLALAVSRNRRRTTIAIGAAFVVLALLLLGLQVAVHAAVLDLAQPGTARDVTSVVWDELMGGFRTQNVITLVVGVLLIVGAAASGRGSSSRAGRARPSRPAEPRAPRARAAR
jgi:hypothetical protein